MNHNQGPLAVSSVAVLGNYLPRQCGIATFTTDLVAALSEPSLALSCGVVAMNDVDKRYDYGEPVVFEIAQSELSSYHRAADFLNVGGFDALSLQHEYGIFGGKAGAHILSTLEHVRMPIITTLHTVLGSPSRDQRKVMDEILRLSSRIVVMSQNGAALLHEVHGVPLQEIDVIPHGIPILPDRAASRRRLRVDETIQLLTFGLLSPDKGIEYVIDSLPEVVARFPEVKYVIVGATHPQLKESQGEAYRRSLQLRAHKLGVTNHVVFHDRFVSARELAEFLAACDVYLTPYLNPEQITSGTLAYAVGTGKAVISTPYRYAQELLAEGRGLLVPPRDAPAIAEALIHLLEDPLKIAGLRERAEAYGVDMTWKAVAAKYKSCFNQAHDELATLRREQVKKGAWGAPGIELPELNLRHVKTLTDDTGILQHAVYSVPRYEDGYCVDDNARALLLMTLLDEGGSDDPTATRTLSTRYLAFVSHAFNPGTRRFRNFMNFSREWTEESGSEDSHGRTLWALGTVVGRANEPGRTSLAGQLFHNALPVVKEFSSPRASAFSLLGIAEYLRAFEGDREVENLQRLLSEKLLSRFSRNFDQPWPWCEDGLYYDNARLPQALIVSGRCLKDEELVRSGIAALNWLTKLQVTEGGFFAPVGSNGFYRRGQSKAQFDQQPVDACATVAACLDAWRATGEKRWAREMWSAFNWFLGENDVSASLYDPSTRGCKDGLHVDRPNENQGAESTLAFLLSLVDMRTLAAEMRLQKSPGTEGN